MASEIRNWKGSLISHERPLIWTYRLTVKGAALEVPKRPEEDVSEVNSRRVVSKYLHIVHRAKCDRKSIMSTIQRGLAENGENHEERKNLEDQAVQSRSNHGEIG